MKFSQQLLAAALLVSPSAVEATSKKAKTSKGVKSGKSSKSSTPPVIGEAEVFHGDYDFINNDSPESVVFDSKGNAYVSLTLTAFISVIDPAGEEIARIDMPQGYCRPDSPTEISFPLSSLQFGMAMSKDDTLYVSLLACAEGFPQPPNPNLNTGLWKVDTEDYSTTMVARVPNANGRGRQDECCAWNERYYSEGGMFGPWTEEMGHMPDGSCDVETCAYYEAWYGSAMFANVDQFTGYAELWNGLEVVGECVYITNSYFHEVWRACPPETDGNTKSGKGKAGKGRRTQEEDMWGVERWMASDASPDLERPAGTFFTTAGFNGIKYFDGALYVANTAQRKIVKVPMEPANPDMGSKSGRVPSVDSIIRATGGRGVVPGTPELIFEGGDVDEFVIDAKGNIYAALFEDNKVLKISPDGASEVILDGGETYGSNCPQFGQGDVYVEDYEPLPTIDLPTSVAFGTNGVTNEMTLYVANSAFVFFKSCAGNPILKPDGTFEYYPGYPGLSRIFVGEMGAEQMW
jgi:sugar lactone lactonase YvrE